MQTRREYAASLGLAKLGVRGKLSRAAHEAINKAVSEGMVFSDAGGNTNIRSGNRNGGVAGTNNSKSGRTEVAGKAAQVSPPQKVTAQAIPEQTIKHQQSTVWAVDDNGRSAIVIALDSCASCMRSINYCLHDVPKLPNWLGGGDALMEKPNVNA